MDHQEKVSPNRLPEALQFDKVLYDLQLLKFDDSSIGLQRDYGSDAPETTVTRDGIEAPNVCVSLIRFDLNNDMSDHHREWFGECSLRAPNSTSYRRTKVSKV